MEQYWIIARSVTYANAGRTTPPVNSTAYAQPRSLNSRGARKMRVRIPAAAVSYTHLIVVGMVLPRQLQICFFHFRICCGFGNAKNLVGIVHVVSSTFLSFFRAGRSARYVPESTAFPT